MKNVYKILIGKPKWRDHSEDVRVDMRIILEWIKPALRPSLPPIQKVPGIPSQGLKRQERDADRSPASSQRLRMREVIPPFPHTSSWRGV